jgi:hypothetical protein
LQLGEAAFAQREDESPPRATAAADGHPIAMDAALSQ